MNRALVFLADGFEEIEAISVIDILRRADIHVDTASLSARLEVTGSHGITIMADILLDSVADIEVYDAVITPGGLPGSTTLRDDSRVLSLIREAATRDRLVASICASPIVLEAAGLTAGKSGTSFPGFRDQLGFQDYREDLVVEDGQLITSRGPATALLFALAIVRRLAGTDTYRKLREALLIPQLLEQIRDY